MNQNPPIESQNENLETEERMGGKPNEVQESPEEGQNVVTYSTKEIISADGTLTKDKKDTKQKNPVQPKMAGAIFNVVNLCIGTSLFSFAYRAKSFGLIWMMVAMVICGAANYWT